ncbi:MAG: hypothetical protein IPJ28_11060 [Betaproteobacteria bacterium]|nr:hypothetical protein [Betaproteobacteria bacterium]
MRSRSAGVRACASSPDFCTSVSMLGRLIMTRESIVMRCSSLGWTVMSRIRGFRIESVFT